MTKQERKEKRAAQKEEQKKEFEAVQKQAKTPEGRYKNARGWLIAVSLFTLANIVFLLLEAEYGFYFSAFLAEAAIMLLDFTTGILVSVVIIGLFLLCWALSKKNHTWLTVGLVLYVIDTIVLLGIMGLTFAEGEFEFLLLVELLFHGMVLYFLSNGVRGAKQLKNMPEETAGKIASDISRDTDQASYF